MSGIKLLQLILCCFWAVQSSQNDPFPYSLSQTIDIHQGVQDVEMSENGDYMYVAYAYEGNGVQVLKRHNDSFEEVQFIKHDGSNSYRDVDATHDGEWLVWIGLRPPAFVYRQNQEGLYDFVQMLQVQDDDHVCISISDDHAFLAIGSQLQVDIFQLDNDKFTYCQAIQVAAWSVQLSTNGESIIVGGDYPSSENWLYHQQSNSNYTLDHTFTHPNLLVWVQMSHDQSMLVLSSNMGKVNVVYRREGDEWKLQQEIVTEGQTRRPSLSSDGQWMALGEQGDSQICRLINHTYTIVANISIDSGWPHYVELTTNEKYLVIVAYNTMKIFVSECTDLECDSCCDSCSSSQNNYQDPSFQECSFCCLIDICECVDNGSNEQNASNQTEDGESDESDDETIQEIVSDPCQGGDFIHHVQCPWTIIIIIVSTVVGLLIMIALIIVIRNLFVTLGRAIKSHTTHQSKDQQEKQTPHTPIVQIPQSTVPTPQYLLNSRTNIYK